MAWEGSHPHERFRERYGVDLRAPEARAIERQIDRGLALKLTKHGKGRKVWAVQVRGGWAFVATRKRRGRHVLATALPDTPRYRALLRRKRRAREEAQHE